MKNKLLNVKVDEQFLSELNEVAEKIDQPYSQIVREAVREKIAEIKKTNPAFEPKIPQAEPLAA